MIDLSQMLAVWWTLFLAQTVLCELSWQNDPFYIVWNAPSKECSRFGIDVNLEKYGIALDHRSTGKGWVGEVITIFPADRMGIYPFVAKNGTVVNGGIPQVVDLSKHLNKMTQDINEYIPNSTFNGLSIIDYEPWRPVWQRDWDQKVVYKNLSEALVRQQHPDWDKKKVEDEAKKQFEVAARKFMKQTLKHANELRPKGKWGYYLFPACYNHDGERDCAESEKTLNNEIDWMFEASSGLYPSIYLEEKNLTANKNVVYGIIKETIRVRKRTSRPYMPVSVYSRVQYRQDKGWYRLGDLYNSMKQAADLGIEGVVVWDDSKMVQDTHACSVLKNYTDNILGPFVIKLLNFTKTCSSNLCHSHGRCVLKDDSKLSKTFWSIKSYDEYEHITKSSTKTLKFRPFVPSKQQNVLSDIRELVNMRIETESTDNTENDVKLWANDINSMEESYVCQCYKGWSGNQCEKSARYFHV